jgi:hypothetical protein
VSVYRRENVPDQKSNNTESHRENKTELIFGQKNSSTKQKTQIK